MNGLVVIYRRPEYASLPMCEHTGCPQAGPRWQTLTGPPHPWHSTPGSDRTEGDPVMRKILASAATAAAAAAVIGGAGLAVASTHTAVSGTEHFQMMTTSGTGSTGSVIASGVFTAPAVDHEGPNNLSTFTFSNGTITVSTRTARARSPSTRRPACSRSTSRHVQAHQRHRRLHRDHRQRQVQAEHPGHRGALGRQVLAEHAAGRVPPGHQREWSGQPAVAGRTASAPGCRHPGEAAAGRVPPRVRAADWPARPVVISRSRRYV